MYGFGCPMCCCQGWSGCSRWNNNDGFGSSWVWIIIIIFILFFLFNNNERRTF